MFVTSKTVEHKTRPPGRGGSLQDQPGPSRPVLLGPVPHALANGVPVNSSRAQFSDFLLAIASILFPKLPFFYFVFVQEREGADASAGRRRYLFIWDNTLQRYLGCHGTFSGQRSGQSMAKHGPVHGDPGGVSPPNPLPVPSGSAVALPVSNTRFAWC